MGEPSDEAFDLACEIVHGNAGPGNAAKMIDEALQAAELRGAEKMRDAAAHKLSEWLNTQALLLACGELSAQEIRVVKAVLDSRIAAILTLDPAAIIEGQSNG